MPKIYQYHQIDSFLLEGSDINLFKKKIEESILNKNKNSKIFENKGQTNKNNLNNLDNRILSSKDYDKINRLEVLKKQLTKELNDSKEKKKIK